LSCVRRAGSIKDPGRASRAASGRALHAFGKHVMNRVRPVESVDGEVAPVRGKDLAYAGARSKQNDRGIAKSIG